MENNNQDVSKINEGDNHVWDNNTSSEDIKAFEVSKSKKWWEEPLPVEEELEDIIHNAKPYNPSESDDDQMTGLKKFMNIATVPHENVAKEISELIRNGHADAIQIFIALKRVGKINELCLDSQKGDKELRDTILNKVKMALDGGKSLDIYGANLRIQATGINYDFSECNDSVLNEMYKIQEQLKGWIKQREEFIKVTLPPDTNKLGIQSKKIIQEGVPSLIWSEDEFEEVIFPAIKRAGESVICTFKKEK